MPYIKREDRSRLNINEPQLVGLPQTPGELNYLITRLIDAYARSRGPLCYSTINEIVGVLNCVGAEFYRRVAAPYEDRKAAENGDVYDCLYKKLGEAIVEDELDKFFKTELLKSFTAWFMKHKDIPER